MTITCNMILIYQPLNNLGAFNGNRGGRHVPTENGVFPLDHLYECDMVKKDYLACLQSTGAQSEKCRVFSKKYLECSMESQFIEFSRFMKGSSIPDQEVNNCPGADQAKEAEVLTSRVYSPGKFLICLEVMSNVSDFIEHIRRLLDSARTGVSKIQRSKVYFLELL